MNPRHLAALCIRRPVGTSLLALGVALAGTVSYFQLPLAPLPQIDFPTIQVRANLPGADPETMAATVTTPLERSLGIIAGVTEMTSSSSSGSSRIILQFDTSRGINGAARDVQAAIDATRSNLPSGMRTPPTYRKFNPSNAPVMLMALTSDTLPISRLYDVASTYLAQKISQVRGVGDATVGGGALPAVRVAANPLLLNHNGLTMDSVRQTITRSNTFRPKGVINIGDRQWRVASNSQLDDAAEYLPLVLSYQNGSAMRLADVAQAQDSLADIYNVGIANGKRAVMIVITMQAGANIIDTIARIRAEMPMLRSIIPAAANLDVLMDRTSTIRASLNEVELALFAAVMLVVLVVYLFFHNMRATLIPLAAVPLSICGTLIAMKLLGFSLNILSLMALTVATGFVVDDAIVVLENIMRHLEKGADRITAAWQGAREVAFTVVSMSLSLVAVFLPILLVSGVVGLMFREFSMTLAIAVLVSMVISLTVTPMMCALLLRRPAHETFVPKREPKVFTAVLRGYSRGLRWAIDHRKSMLLLLLMVVVVNVIMYASIPKGLIPDQDTGRLAGSLVGDQSASFESMKQKLGEMVNLVGKDSAVTDVSGFVSGQGSNGNLFVMLKDRSQRESADAVIARLRKATSHISGVRLYLQSFQDVRFGGRSASAKYQYTLLSSDLNDLRAWAPKVRQAMSTLPSLVDVNTDASDKGGAIYVDIDRSRASFLGIPMRSITDTFSDSFGQRAVGTIYQPLNQYQVILEAPRAMQSSLDTLQRLNLLAKNNISTPLGAVATLRQKTAPLSVQHQSLFAATTVSFNLPEKTSLSQATGEIEKAMRGLGLPPSVYGSFQGTAKAFQAATSNQLLLVLAAILTIYMVLGILYENSFHPITILSTLPSAGLGALLALRLFSVEFSIITFIGVILLTGIVKKNAILMIDVAIALRRGGEQALWHGVAQVPPARLPEGEASAPQGMTPEEAIYTACRLRLRPILMTTLAAICGALPLAIAGTEFGRPLGLSIIGGLVVSQVLTLFTTPVIYLYMERLSDWVHRRFRRVSPA